MFKEKQLGKRKHVDSKPQNTTAIKGSNLAAVGKDVSNRRAAPQTQSSSPGTAELLDAMKM